MAEKLTCEQCGQPMMDGICVNQQCSLTTGDSEMALGSLSPSDVLSEMSQIIDYTGTIGVAPEEFNSDFGQDSLVANEDDSAQTRMIDDDFYKQIQEHFPAESGSKSAKGDSAVPGSASRGPNAEVSPTVSLQLDQASYSVEEFVPPVRDIRFPSDTASLDQIRELDEADIEGDEYHIVDKLGEGGYGVVFEAEQTALNRPVAIKVLKPKRRKTGSRSNGPSGSGSGSGTGTGELQRRRDQFLHEAKITARLQHPNIVPLYDFGINSTGELFYSMKKVQRRPWSDVLHKPARLLNIADSDVDDLAERQAISRNIEIFSRVCEGMAYAHSMKVIHRDLKPDNIMIGDYGEVLLIDFGMALDLAAASKDFSAGGTLVYMAPEMAEHFTKQKEIQVAAQKTAKRMGVEKGTVFLDKSNLIGIGKLAEQLVQEAADKDVVELAETLIRLSGEEKELADKISYASDIYLLGAVLYQVAVGHPPHYFPLAACKKGALEKFQKELWLASRNGFQQYSKITDPLRLSLRAIAMKAMETDPNDRYQTVEELQEAIRGFQLQVQSMELAETGKEELAKSKGREDYQHLLPALESFRGASELWPEGEETKVLQRETACEYANRAHDRKDFDAGLSILDEYVLDFQQQDEPVLQAREKLAKGKQIRTRNRRLAIAGWIATVVIPFIAIGLAIPVLSQARNAKAAAAIAKQAEKEANHKLTQVQPALAKARKDIEEADAKVAKANQKAKDADDKAIEANKLAEGANKLAEEAKALAKTEAENARLAKVKSDDALKKLLENTDKLAKAQETLNVAKEAEKKSKQLANKYQFDADFGEYNSSVLTIPLDFRTSKLEEAKSKLNNLVSSNDTQPQFKNGWLVKHFAKRLGAGQRVQVSENGQVLKLLAIPQSEIGQSLAIGVEAGSPAIWNVNADGQVEKRNLEIPAIGQVMDASISANGNWLALAMESTDAKIGGNVVLMNLDDGSRVNLPQENVEKLAGCRYVQFADRENDRMIVVEEIKGHFDLKHRVHVVEYQLVDQQLNEVSRTPVRATERNEGRVEYLANIRWIDGQAVTGIAFASLSDGGDEAKRLQVVTGNKASVAISPQHFPSALLVGQNGKLFCGRLDGTVEYYNRNDLQSGSTPLRNLNLSEIAVLVQVTDGRLISGSENGKIVIWNADLSFSKEVDGQQGQLSALVIAGADAQDGLRMLSGDLSGGINYWKPETGLGDAILDKTIPATVSCGAIDQGLAAGAVPATAFGAGGEVYYFDSEAMVKRGGGKKVGDKSNGLQLGATFSFRSPFESFDTAFNDFDSMGIIGNFFVVMKDDGTLFTALINKGQGRQELPSSNVRNFRCRDFDQMNQDFVPLLSSVYNQDYFYTNDPADETQLLLWNRAGKNFSVKPIESYEFDGEIKRLAMSNDGRWLAVVRLADRSSGQYFAEIFNITAGSGELSLATTTQTYRVGDPAFVGFSADSRKLMLHSHKLGTDRETWVEQWQLAGSVWTLDLPRRKVANRKIDVIDWKSNGQAEQLVTRLNRKFYLSPLTTDAQDNLRQSFVTTGSGRLRKVLSARQEDQFYVLTSNHLARHQGLESVKEVSQLGKSVIENARDMRVFGEQIVILDQAGFHLFDEKLNYVSLLASRKPVVDAVALSNGRLAIQYDNQLCRIWDVSGETPRGVGRVERVLNVQLSPDGKWAACQIGEELRVFDIRMNFKDPKQVVPLSKSVYHWSGKTESKLIMASEKDGATEWVEVDPATGKKIVRRDLPTNLAGVTDFALAPLTERFVAIVQNSGDVDSLSVWATGANPLRMNKEEHEFDVAGIERIDSISFSEIAQENLDAVGTRMAVLGGAANEEAVPRIYLAAKQKQNLADQKKGDQPIYRYRVVEIEGALQFSANDGLKLSDLDFAGDGKSLLQVHKKGTQTLISQ